MEFNLDRILYKYNIIKEGYDSICFYKIKKQKYISEISFDIHLAVLFQQSFLCIIFIDIILLVINVGPISFVVRNYVSI